jgi:hypothetical protein
MADLRTELERAGRHAPPLEDDPFDRLRVRRERKSRRGRVAAASVSLAVAFTAIAGLWTAFRPHDAPPAPRHTASGPSVDLTVPPDQYYFLHQDWYGPPSQVDGVDGPEHYGTTTWYRADDSGRIVTVQNGEHTDRSFDAGAFQQDTGDLTYLSTDPAELLGQMTERMQPNGRSPEPFDQFSPGPGQDGHVTAGLVRSIGELLNDPNSEPALKAALFQVASALQGMSETQNATDPTGRAATLLSIQTEGALHEWWFDPTSEQLLAMRVSDAASGEVYGVEVVQASGVTESTDDDAALVTSFVPPPVHDPAKP